MYKCFVNLFVAFTSVPLMSMSLTFNILVSCAGNSMRMRTKEFKVHLQMQNVLYSSVSVGAEGWY